MRTIMALIIFLLLSGCGAPASPAATETPTPLPFLTATLIPTFTPRPSLTPAPPTIAPTLAPVTGLVTTQVNVRAAPDANASALGQLNYNDRVQVLGKDISEQWLMLIYPLNAGTTAWVTAAYIQFENGKVADLPVVASTPPTLAADTTSQPLATPTANPRFATLTKAINVRAGPASSYDSYGMLEAGKVVVTTGRNETNTWIQIEYSAGVDGRAWVAAAYVEGANLQGLPYFNNQGELLFAPTAIANPGQPSLTPTGFAPAALDGDSEQKPVARLEFSPSGAQALSYSSDLSSPNGDDVDWVSFIPYVPTSEAGYVYVRLDCSGNGGITASIEKDSLPIPGAPELHCGNYGMAYKVLGAQPYMFILRADGSGGPLRYVSYTLTISSNP
jgi:uncharacterized protein YraI